MKELEMLRKEKQQGIQRGRAAEALKKAGISPSFAELLAGVSDEETDCRAERFCAVYQETLAEDIRTRLPKEAPVMSQPPVPRAKRGIQRIR